MGFTYFVFKALSFWLQSWTSHIPGKRKIDAGFYLFSAEKNNNDGNQKQCKGNQKQCKGNRSTISSRAVLFVAIHGGTSSQGAFAILFLTPRWIEPRSHGGRGLSSEKAGHPLKYKMADPPPQPAAGCSAHKWTSHNHKNRYVAEIAGSWWNKAQFFVLYMLLKTKQLTSGTISHQLIYQAKFWDKVLLFNFGTAILFFARETNWKWFPSLCCFVGLFLCLWVHMFNICSTGVSRLIRTCFIRIHGRLERITKKGKQSLMGWISRLIQHSPGFKDFPWCFLFGLGGTHLYMHLAKKRVDDCFSSL